jgi:hypothetical protein
MTRLPSVFTAPKCGQNSRVPIGAKPAPSASGRAGVTEYTGNPRSHTVQNTGSGVYHLVLVENLKDTGWTTYEAPGTGSLLWES